MSKYIQEMAEKKSPYTIPQFHSGFVEGYTAGAQDMKEHIGGFAEWIPGRYYFSMHHEQHGGMWLPALLENPTTEDLITTDQLVEKYFEQLNQKQP